MKDDKIDVAEQGLSDNSDAFRLEESAKYFYFSSPHISGGPLSPNGSGLKWGNHLGRYKGCQELIME